MDLLNELFETGPVDAAITTANTSASSVVGTAPTFTDTDPMEGELSALMSPANAQSMMRFDHTPVAQAWYLWYFRFPAYPVGPTYIASFFNGTSRIGDLRIETDGTISVRNNFAAAITSTVSMTPGVECAIALRVAPGQTNGLELRLYNGENARGSGAADFTGTGNSTVAQSQVSNIRLGVVTAAAFTHRVDRLIGSSTAEPERMAGVVPADPPPIYYVKVGTELVAHELYIEP